MRVKKMERDQASKFDVRRHFRASNTEGAWTPTEGEMRWLFEQVKVYADIRHLRISDRPRHSGVEVDLGNRTRLFVMGPTYRNRNQTTLLEQVREAEYEREIRDACHEKRRRRAVAVLKVCELKQRIRKRFRHREAALMLVATLAEIASEAVVPFIEKLRR